MEVVKIIYFIQHFNIIFYKKSGKNLGEARE